MQTTINRHGASTTTAIRRDAPVPGRTHWRHGLPALPGREFALREICASDAASLVALLNGAEVARFMAAPPPTIEGFERFIAWSRAERTAGRHLCFAVVPSGTDVAAGLIQFRLSGPDFTVAEWGFALGVQFWGTGIFNAAARLAIDFAFEAVGLERLEARAAVTNGRGNGALAKLGAVREGVRRHSFIKDGIAVDQTVWSIARDEWRHAKVAWPSWIH